MKLNYLVLPLLLLASSSAFAAEKFTLVTENTVDARNIFTHPDLRPISPSQVGLPENLAHVYVLRATYTILNTEAQGVVSKVDAGCDGMDGAVSCWEDHLVGTLDLRNAGNNARWELIDQTTGKTLAVRTQHLEIDPVRIETKTMQEKLEFAGAQYMGPPRFSPQPDAEFFLDNGKNFSLYFSKLFLDDAYRSARLVVEARGNGRFALAGIQYGGQTATGNTIPVVPGALFPNAGAWLTKGTDHSHPFLLGEPGGRRAFTNIKVISAD